MEMQEIEILINADGDVIIHVNGVHGEKCTELTAALEEALGTVESRQYTGDYYQADLRVCHGDTIRTEE
jgi:Protein of unknown function (DUF2997).